MSALICAPVANPIDHKFLRQLRIVSYTEGVSTLLLFGGAMPLKYAADMPMAVTVVGTIHGFLFVLLVAMFVLAINRVPMPASLASWGMVAALFPFGPFIFDSRLAHLDR